MILGVDVLILVVVKLGSMEVMVLRLLNCSLFVLYFSVKLKFVIFVKVFIEIGI